MRRTSKECRILAAEDLFYSQIVTLEERGCPKQIIEMFLKQKDSVLHYVTTISFDKGNDTFIPVVPLACRTFYDLMTMVKVRNCDEQGYIYIDPTIIIDEVKTSEKPYYIYNVEDGRTLLGKSPEEAIEIIEKQQRSPLTMTEVMALVAHTKALWHHNVNALGSRCGPNKVPQIFLDYGGYNIPKLSYCELGSKLEKWGSPSCGIR